MEPILDSNRIVDEYFRIWKAYDIQGIRRLFDTKAIYEIKSKQKFFKGHFEICNYWKRNAWRQKGLQLIWDIVSLKKSFIEVHFLAEFYDTEETESQKVEGIINFYLNKQNNIILLSEHYQKLIISGVEYESGIIRNKIWNY